MRLDGQLIRFYLDLVHRNKPKQLFANGRARQQSRLIWAQLDSRRTEARPRRQCGTVAIATELMGCQRKDLERVGGTRDDENNTGTNMSGSPHGKEGRARSRAHAEGFARCFPRN